MFRNYLFPMVSTLPSCASILAFLIGLLSACSTGAESEADTPDSSGGTLKPLRWELGESIPMPSGAFTQGLVVDGDSLWLGTGVYGKSRLMKLRLSDGEILESRDLPRQLFGEGVTFLKDRIYQLTWQAGMVLVYDRHSLERLGQFRITTEGWGITHNGSQLIMSAGLPNLQFIDPASYRVVQKVEVHRQGVPVGSLNELEFVKGWVLANVWTSNKVLVIDPESGEVQGFFDFSRIAADARKRQPSVDVLNGIAHDPATDELLITGKLYDRIYRVKALEWPRKENKKAP